MRGFLVLVVIAAVLALAGCTEAGPQHYHLKGKVTMGGQAVPAGMIFFDPDFSQGNDGQQGFAAIKNGEFDTRANGQPTMGGPHVVRIQAFDGILANELPMGQKIAPEHSTTADLPKEDSSQDFAVPRPGEA